MTIDITKLRELAQKPPEEVLWELMQENKRLRTIEAAARNLAKAKGGTHGNRNESVTGVVEMINARYIEVGAEVRYWEDARLNGQEDTAGNIPLRKSDSWCPVIDLQTGEVIGWPEGMTADVHYKVCDQGEYWLLDESKQRIAKWKGYYVPNDILCVGDNGYGDYIIFKIDADGRINGWRNPGIDDDEWEALK